MSAGFYRAVRARGDGWCVVWVRDLLAPPVPPLAGALSAADALALATFRNAERFLDALEGLR